MRHANLGSLPASGWRPARGWESTYFTVGRRPPISSVDLKRVVENARTRAAQRLFTPALAIRTCGEPGGLPCASATPQAGLGHLGLVNVSACSAFEEAINALGEALKRAKEANVSNQDVQRAQERYDRETSLLLWRRSFVTWFDCKEKTQDIRQLIELVNAALSKAGASPVQLPPSTVAETSPNETASTVKTVAIALGIIAGAVVLAPLVWEGVAWAKVARKAKGK